MRHIPHQPGDGKLLEPIGRGITQVTEPKQHKIAVSEGDERLDTGGAALSTCGAGLPLFPLDRDGTVLLSAAVHS